MSTLALVTYILIAVSIISTVIFSIWVTIGGYFDLMSLFRDLKSERSNLEDDGRVKE
jgi:hypothetical protein